MSSQGNKKPVHEIVAAIESLDLEPIKQKLMHPEAGEGWSREVVDALEQDYKRFLTLHAKYPGTAIVPSKETDQFWHAHILDTVKYARDCEQAFGYFVHHSPSLEAQPVTKEAAFCSVVAKKSFCSVAIEKSFCSIAAKKSFCSIAVEKAFCSVAVKPAFCSVAARNDAAFCSVAVQAAFCSVAVAA